MKTKAVRLYGKNDLRLETFELPALGDDEILAHIVSDSICMSTYKAAIQGPDHKRVPDDVAENPTIIGHEFCGTLLEVGEKWRHKFKAGDKFAIQPALMYKGSLDAPGYSFRYIGGAATHVVIPNEVMEMNCLLKYEADAFYYGSLAEPMSCIVGGFHASYHTKEYGKYDHAMGIKEGGYMALLAGVGPMGLGAIDYALHNPIRPKLLVVTDVDDARLSRAKSLFTDEIAKKAGVDLRFFNTSDPAAEAEIMALTGGAGYDDVFVYAPVKPVIEQGDRLLGRDGCMNFFAGPTDPKFSALFNFYNVHYAQTHIAGTSGGNTNDMIESLEMMSKGLINPSAMVTHIGGLSATVETTLNLPKIPGGKKLIYNNIEMPLTAISDFDKQDGPLFKELSAIVARHNGLWNAEAEKYLLANAKPIE